MWVLLSEQERVGDLPSFFCLPSKASILPLPPWSAQASSPGKCHGWILSTHISLHAVHLILSRGRGLHHCCFGKELINEFTDDVHEEVVVNICQVLTIQHPPATRSFYQVLVQQ